MIFTDEIIQEMAKIVKAQETDPLYNSDSAPLKIDMSQFSLAPQVTEEHIDMANIPMIQHVVVAASASEDKKILKEKKRAIEVGDIIEEAHSEQAHMAEGPMGTGVVENQNEQHAKMLNVVYKQPAGFNFNTFADAVNTLVKVAEKLEASGDLEGVRKVDAILQELISKKADGGAQQKALPPSSIVAPPPLEPDDILEPVRKNSPKLPPKSVETIPGEYGNLPMTSKDINPSGGTPNNQKGIPTSTPNRSLPPGSNAIGPVKNKPQPHPIKDVYQVPNKALPAMMPKGKSGIGFIESLLMKLKNLKGGKAGMVAALAGGVAASVLALYSASKNDWSKNIAIARKNAESFFDKSVLNLVNSMDDLYSRGEEAVKDGSVNPEDIAAIDELKSQASQLASIAGKVNDEMLDAAKALEGISLDLHNQSGNIIESTVNKANNAVGNAGRVEDSAVKDERMNGMKTFFNETAGDTMSPGSSSDERLKQHIRRFVADMKDDFPPEFAMNATSLTEENILQKGNYQMLKDLDRAWNYPKLIVDELDRKKSN